MFQQRRIGSNGAPQLLLAKAVAWFGNMHPPAPHSPLVLNVRTGFRTIPSEWARGAITRPASSNGTQAARERSR